MDSNPFLVGVHLNHTEGWVMSGMNVCGSSALSYGRPQDRYLVVPPLHVLNDRAHVEKRDLKNA